MAGMVHHRTPSMGAHRARPYHRALNMDHDHRVHHTLDYTSSDCTAKGMVQCMACIGTHTGDHTAHVGNSMDSSFDMEDMPPDTQPHSYGHRATFGYTCCHILVKATFHINLAASETLMSTTSNSTTLLLAYFVFNVFKTGYNDFVLAY